VIATFAPKAEIFAKDYLPPVKASMLSEIKAIEVPLDFIKRLQLSQTKSKRKCLWLQNEGIKGQKKERFKIMSKKYSNALLEEEMKEEDRKSKSRSTARTATNQSAFKIIRPQQRRPTAAAMQVAPPWTSSTPLPNPQYSLSNSASHLVWTSA
jgi:hypothetical protein